MATKKIGDICMKRNKRDFVDLFWYCQIRHEPLLEIIKRYAVQHRGLEKNITHILGSLVNFERFEKNPMPKIFFKANWKSIKMFFKSEVVKTTKKFLDLS